MAPTAGAGRDPPAVSAARLQTALYGLVARLGDARYSHYALREAQRRRDAAARPLKAFGAGVLDWRKKDGPSVRSGLWPAGRAKCFHALSAFPFFGGGAPITNAPPGPVTPPR